MDPFSPSPDPFATTPVKSPESVIPETMGRVPTADEMKLIEGTEIGMISSNVYSIQWRWGEYDSSGNPIYDPRLFVRFNNEYLYQYNGVSLETALEFMHAPSAGRFVWQRLRDQYPTERIS